MSQVAKWLFYAHAVFKKTGSARFNKLTSSE